MRQPARTCRALAASGLTVSLLGGVSGAQEFAPQVAEAAGIAISFDSEAARATIEALSGKRARDLTAVARLPGNVLLIDQTARFDKAATEKRFIASLREAAAGKDPSPDTFALSRTRARLEEPRALLRRIEEDPVGLAASLRARIAKYTPPDLKLPVKVYFIVGGTSDAFSRDDVFCTALDYFQGDIEGMKTLMAHELYHVARDAAVKRRSSAVSRTGRPAAAARVLRLLDDTINEGVASRVGDPTEVSGGRWIEWFRGKFERNRERLDASFALFDTILYREYNDPDAPVDRLYQIGFTGSWDSALYFVGYEIARVIEQEDGAAAIARSLSESPLRPFQRYVAIARAHPDRVKHPLARSTVSILEKVAASDRVR